jgi:hypothetical protein
MEKGWALRSCFFGRGHTGLVASGKGVRLRLVVEGE